MGKWISLAHATFFFPRAKPLVRSRWYVKRVNKALSQARRWMFAFMSEPHVLLLNVFERRQYDVSHSETKELSSSSLDSTLFGMCGSQLVVKVKPE